jgi:uncharacterized protein (DUF433 family)
VIFSEINPSLSYLFFPEIQPMNVIPGEMMSLEYLGGRITVHPDICNGHPTIRGMRITVETVLGFLSAGDSPEEILRQYPSLEAADIDACLRFAADLMSRRYSLQGVA